jgi:alpha-tubulin suppressor-like RCC1 family protein
MYNSSDWAAVSVYARGNFTCILTSTLEVFCWGQNSHGQLGLGDTSSRGDESGEMGKNLLKVDLGTVSVRYLALGASHACAITSAHFNSVKCWGDNSYGQVIF